MIERRANPIGRAATAGVPRISLGGLRLAVLDIEQTANFMIDVVFPKRRLGRPLYLTSANGEVLARCSTEPMTGRLFRAALGKKLPDFAAEIDCVSWGQFFLKFILGHPAVTAVIPGTDKPEHMLDNLGAGHGRLPDAAMRARMAKYVEQLG